MSKTKTTAGLPFTTEEYIKAQINADFRPGDKVRVARKAESYESGWLNDWVPEMDAFVGTEVEVAPDQCGCPTEQGVSLRSPGKDVPFRFPYFILEVVK